MLRKSKEYQGFKINSLCFNVSLFADDTVIINYVFNIPDYFGNKSLRKVNLRKSSAVYVGSSRGKF